MPQVLHMVQHGTVLDPHATLKIHVSQDSPTMKKPLVSSTLLLRSFLTASVMSARDVGEASPQQFT